MSLITNAQKIAGWRDDSPKVQLSAKILCELLQVADLRAANLRHADLRGADLGGANLTDANLRYADLGYANLGRADLWRADLGAADLRRANLRGADLGYANLGYANLGYADLWRADLGAADLRRANLRGANLTDANLRGADLRGADQYGFFQFSTPSGAGHLVPTPEGWQVTIGCWEHETLTDLADLMTDPEWPESTGVEHDRRRPIFAALLTFFEAHTDYHAEIVTQLARQWGTK